MLKFGKNKQSPDTTEILENEINEVEETVEEIGEEINEELVEEETKKKDKKGFSLFGLGKKKTEGREEEEKEEEKDKEKYLSFNEATDYIQQLFIQRNEQDLGMLQSVQSSAMAGERESRNRIIELFKDIINEYKIVVEGYTVDRLAKDVFSEKYGLGILDKYFLDPTIDEIRVNGIDNIKIVRNGMPLRIEETFDNEEQIERTIKRLIMEDMGISIDKSNPRIESILLDGSRLTATCYPVSPNWNFILRKHDSFEPTLENYKEVGTLDEFVWDRLSVLVRGNTKMLISGNVSSGKSTLLTKLVGELDENFRIGVIGKNNEIKLMEKYPERDVIEFQEQPQLGVNMKELFTTMLRESIDSLVVEEFRGSGEAIEAVRACGRGLPSAFSTAHFNNAKEAIEGVGLLLIEEGLNLTLDLAKLRVARAFNIVIQLFGDTISGKKKLISVSEVRIDDKDQIIVNDLIRWTPHTDDFYGAGEWIAPNQPSDDMLKTMLINVSREEVESLGWDTSRI